MSLDPPPPHGDPMTLPATHCTVHLVDQPSSEHRGKPVLLVRDVLGDGIDSWCVTCTEHRREGAPLAETPFAIAQVKKAEPPRLRHVCPNGPACLNNPCGWIRVTK